MKITECDHSRTGPPILHMQRAYQHQPKSKKQKEKTKNREFFVCTFKSFLGRVFLEREDRKITPIETCEQRKSYLKEILETPDP